MLMLIGIIAALLGIFSFLTAFGSIDSGPEWKSIFGPIGYFLFFGGLATFLIGVGAFFSHPHTLHF